jgi:hypothetical protein
MAMARLLIAGKQKYRYDPFVQALDKAQADRRRLGRDAVACPAMGRMAKKIREEISPEVECNALKRHDSRVNKRVKSSAERVTNACRTHAERALNDAGRRPNAPRSADDGRNEGAGLT